MNINWAYLADPDPIVGMEDICIEGQRFALYLERQHSLYYGRDYTMQQKEQILEITPKAKSLHDGMQKAVEALVHLRLFGHEIKAALIRENDFHSHRVRYQPW